MIKLLLLGIALFILPRTDPNTASMGGYVTDENRTPISAATVSVRNVFSGQVEVTKTGPTGSYSLTGMKQARYSAYAEAEGHASVWVFNIILSSGENRQLDFTLTREPGHGDLAPDALME